jgi:thioredoxin 1/putative thioredoxin
MPLVEITEHNFESELLSSELPVLVEFGAEWCGPCKTVAPELEALANELRGQARVAHVDIDKSPRLARELGVQSVPTFVVFHRGRPVDGKVGAMKRAALRAMLEPVLPRAAGALNPEEVQALVQVGQVTLVDTREPPVFQRAHLPGALNMPLEGIESRLAELHMLPGAPVIYCRAGDQTKELAERLAQQGIPVSFLEGGVLGWEAAGFELERPD